MKSNNDQISYMLSGGGAAGNFLACLIKIMDNTFSDSEKISKNGGCDNISGSGAIFGYYSAANKNPYPENSSMAKEIADLILDMKRLDPFTKPLSDGSYVMSIHYITKESINLFRSVDEVKIIYISVHPDFHKQVALNKVAKNYISADKTDVNSKDWSNEIARTLRYQGFHDSADLMENQIDVLGSSRQSKENLITAWTQRLSEVEYVPDEDENLMVIDFKDIMLNKDLVLNKISSFINRPVNSFAKEFYNEYISLQPNIEDFLTC